MNFTESFIFQMAIVYAGMMESTNPNLTPAQQTAVAQAIASCQGLIAAFTKPVA